jgi:ribonuclease D
LRPERYRVPPEEAWRRVSGTSQLKGRQRAVLRVLATWRERKAQQLDKPRRWVVADDALLELSRRMPKSDAELSKLRNVPAEVLRDHGRELLEQVTLGRNLPQDQWPTLEPKLRLTPTQEAVVDACLALLKTCALEEGVSAQSLASRRDVERIVAGERDHPLLTGWRAAVAGQRLKALLAGEVGLIVEQGKLMLIDKAEPDAGAG